MTRVTRVLVLAVAVTLSAGCATSGLSFRQDERVSVVTPGDNERRALPLEISWEAHDYDGYFAVFIDRSPMRPNQGLLALVPDDDPCRQRDVCPDAEWLADRHVYVTRETSLVVERLPDRRAGDRGSDRHELTIVFLDEDGTRRGEPAFVREFIVDRAG